MPDAPIARALATHWSSLAIRGALTLVLRRRGGAWVIAAGHESVRPFDDVHEAGAVPSR